MRVAVSYRYSPGDDDDGATVSVQEGELTRLESWRLERAIPGLLQAQVSYWCERLAKSDRQLLQPLEHRILEWVEALQGSSEPLAQAMHRLWHEALGPEAQLPACKTPPVWSRLRLRITNDEGKVVSTTRDLSQIGGEQADDPIQALRAQWQSEPSIDWPGEVPLTCGHASQPAYAAVVRCRAKDASLAVQRSVFASRSAAEAWHVDGVATFLEAQLQGDIEVFVQGVKSSADDEAAAIRGALSSLWQQLPLRDCRSDDQAQELLADARALMRGQQQQIRDWARELSGVRKVFASRLRKGANGLAALAQMGQIQRLEQTFSWAAMVAWLSLWAMQQLPAWLNALIDMLDGKCRISSVTRLARSVFYPIGMTSTLNSPCPWRALWVKLRPGVLFRLTLVHAGTRSFKVKSRINRRVNYPCVPPCKNCVQAIIRPPKTGINQLGSCAIFASRCSESVAQWRSICPRK